MKGAAAGEGRLPTEVVRRVFDRIRSRAKSKEEVDLTPREKEILVSFCRYVTRRLLDQGVRVRTLTRSPDAEEPFGGRVEVAPLDFSGPDGLRRSMQGAGVFYNTYWVRYSHCRITFDLAVENTRTLFEAAKSAGVRRIVPNHIWKVVPSIVQSGRQWCCQQSNTALQTSQPQFKNGSVYGEKRPT